MVKGPVAVVGDTVLGTTDYTAKSNSELTFSRGDKFVVQDDSEQNWLKVKTGDGKEGYVPTPYVCKEGALEFYPWFHGPISRSSSVHMLNKVAKQGVFLIRESQTSPGSYTLDVFVVAVSHYRIKNQDGKYFFVDNVTFGSVAELVETCMKTSQTGLPCELKEWIPTSRALATVLSRSEDQDWELVRDAVKLGKQVGSGNFGDVFLGTWNGKQVAVKTVKEGAMASAEFMREVQVMKKLQHPNLVRLYGVCSTELPMYMVLEFVPNGDLLNFVKAPGAEKTISPREMIYMSSQIAEGMAFLEGAHTIHRDLAARNILVGDNLAMKIADFGMGRVVDELYTASTGTQMPIRWTAPEALEQDLFSSKSDVWSFGVLMWEIASFGQTPYPTLQNNEILKELKSGFRLPMPELCDPTLYMVMKECWEISVAKRPTFAQVVQMLEGADHEYSEKEPAVVAATQSQKMLKVQTMKQEAIAKESESATTNAALDVAKDAQSKCTSLARFGRQETLKAQVAETYDAAMRLVSASEFAKKPLKKEIKAVTSAAKTLHKCKLKVEKTGPAAEKLRTAVNTLASALKSHLASLKA